MSDQSRAIAECHRAIMSGSETLEEARYIVRWLKNEFDGMTEYGWSEVKEGK